MDETPSWGIDPVPERLRVLGLFDLTLLWGNLSVSLLVIVAAAGLVPMLSFKQALLAILIGALAGNLLLGLAAAIGQPKAVRAVGSANGDNHVAVLIPCHRVIRSDGSRGGYAYGLDIKRELLARERG